MRRSKPLTVRYLLFHHAVPYDVPYHTDAQESQVSGRLSWATLQDSSLVPTASVEWAIVNMFCFDRNPKAEFCNFSLMTASVVVVGCKKSVMEMWRISRGRGMCSLRWVTGFTLDHTESSRRAPALTLHWSFSPLTQSYNTMMTMLLYGEIRSLTARTDPSRNRPIRTTIRREDTICLQESQSTRSGGQNRWYYPSPLTTARTRHDALTLHMVYCNSVSFATSANPFGGFLASRLDYSFSLSMATFTML